MQNNIRPMLREKFFDLLVLDIVLPATVDQAADAGEGVKLRKYFQYLTATRRRRTLSV